MKRTTLTVFGFALLSLLTFNMAAQDSAIVVINGTLIDGTGSDPIADAAVIIDDGLIVAVGPASDIDIPGDAVHIDANGGTILPGIVDTHTHILDALRVDDGEITGLFANLHLVGPLQAGVTAFRDAGSVYGVSRSIDEWHSALARLDRVVQTVVMTGPILAAPDNWVFEDFGANSLAVEDVPAAVDAVNNLLDGGADQIKIMVETGFSDTPTPNLSAEQIQAISDAARARGAWVLAHVSDVAEAELAVMNGVDELTHWPGEDMLPDELIAELVKRDIPVGSTFNLIFPYEGDVRRLLDAGGRILLSSDAPGTMGLRDVRREMNLMLDAGMTPMEVILASTSHAADALGLGDTLGSIEVDKAADLIVVEGKPLEDFSVIRNVVLVIKSGEVVSQE